jgi:hypothetical protein
MKARNFGSVLRISDANPNGYDVVYSQRSKEFMVVWGATDPTDGRAGIFGRLRRLLSARRLRARIVAEAVDSTGNRTTARRTIALKK